MYRKEDPQADYVKMLISQIKEDFNDATKSKSLSKTEKQKAGGQTEYDAMDGEALCMKEQLQLYYIVSSQSMVLKEHERQLTAVDQSRNNHAAAQLLINLKIKRHLMLLQGVYQEILGPLFRYKLGIEVSVCAQTCGISYVVV